MSKLVSVFLGDEKENILLDGHRSAQLNFRGPDCGTKPKMGPTMGGAKTPGPSPKLDPTCFVLLL